MFGALYAADGTPADALIAVAREFSPRIEVHGPREVVMDLAGLARLFGDARTLGQELQRTARTHGCRIRVAIAGSRTAARLLAIAGGHITVVEMGTEADSLAPLPLDLLAALDAGADASDADKLRRTFRRWGLRTIGDLAVLPSDAVAARLGPEAVAWQQLARGADTRPLVPAIPDERFEEALDLEWPIEGLEPLSFVLGRLMEPLAARLARRGRGAAVLHVRLRLVTRAVHERSLELPAPMHDARTLRTLALLDLESHPPSAAIDRVEIAIDPTPARVVQFSLLTRPLPSPEQLSTLMARLGALMGAGRCGSPAMVDAWQPGVFAMTPFAPTETPPASLTSPASRAPVALRRFRVPVPARVRLEEGRPSRVATDRPGLSGGHVEAWAGPWRTSGGWWIEAAGDAQWDRDEWDVTLSDGATYRVFRERAGDAWFLEGIID